jgi:hypothetical protein
MPSMSFAGSIESMTVRSGMWAGSGIWTMIPATVGSALNRSISVQSASAVTSTPISTSRPSTPTFWQVRRICCRYTAEGAFAPTRTIARVGA